MLLLLQPRRGSRIPQDILLHQLILLRPFLQSLAQVVRDALTFQLRLLRLQGWCCGGVEEDVAVLEVGFVWAVLFTDRSWLVVSGGMRS